MKNLFLLYACAEKFRAAKTGAINVPLSPEASMAEFRAAKREDAMKFLEFFRKRAEYGLEILKFLDARHFGLQGAAVKRRSEILKFSAAERLKRRFESQNQAAEFLNFAPMPCNRFEILKFTRASAPFADTVQNFISQRGLRILKLIRALPRASRRILPRADKAEAGRAARLASQHTYDATEKRRAVKINHASGLDSAQRRIARLCSAAARHGYKTARAENFSKFDLTGALLNFKSRFTMQLCSAVTRRNYEAWRSEIYAVCLHKYPVLIRAASGKISRYEVGRATNTLISQGVKRIKFYALNRYTMKFLKFLGANRFGWQTAAWFLKFKPESSHSRPEILNFMFASYKLKLALRKFTLAVRKIKSASAVRLNFALNSVPRAYAAKFENGVKFKAVAKFKRGAQ
nr:hypothetical protein [uncultured Campylobacter sp.]